MDIWWALSSHINWKGKHFLIITIHFFQQLEDTKRLGDSEARDRAALLSKFKNVNSELENLRERIEEESEKKSDALKALSKAQAEIQLWKSKFETDGMGRIDDLEGGKQKLSARLSEAEETIDTLNQKVATTEKTKHRLEVELEDLQLEYERVHAAAIITEKRGRNFDKVIFLHIDTIIFSFKYYRPVCVLNQFWKLEFATFFKKFSIMWYCGMYYC